MCDVLEGATLKRKNSKGGIGTEIAIYDPEFAARLWKLNGIQKT